MNILNYFIDRFPIEWKILEAFDKIANDFLPEYEDNEEDLHNLVDNG